MPRGGSGFTYDVVIGPRTSQADVFKMTAKAVLNKVLRASTEQSWRTARQGQEDLHDVRVDRAAGHYSSICANIFLAVQEDKTSEYNVKCSYVEIYNEMLHDLLTKSTHRRS